MTRTLLRTLAVAAAGLALAGCISLFPKSKPAQMYRFGGSEAAAAPSPAGKAVAKAATSFARAAGGDQILTVTGQELAYIGQARWVAPAAQLFDDAVERAFDAKEGGPRLVQRGDLLNADIALRIDVDTFETRYLEGPESAPTVAVSFRASLIRTRDRQVMGERVFAASKPAASNRVGSIVDAYDSAVRETVGQLVDWTAGTVG